METTCIWTFFCVVVQILYSNDYFFLLNMGKCEINHADTFRLPLCNYWTEFDKNWQDARTQRLPSSLYISGRSNKKMSVHASDWLIHVLFLLDANTERNFTKIYSTQKLNVLYYQVFFRTDQKTRVPKCANFLTDRPWRPFLFTDQPEKHRLGREHWDLASCQVSLKSVQRF